MSNLRDLTRAVLATLPLFMIGGSLEARADDSIWSHNGSASRWVSEGERQTAYYIEAREGLLTAMVVMDAVFGVAGVVAAPIF